MAAVASGPSAPRRFAVEPPVDLSGQEFGRRVAAGEFRHVIEIAESNSPSTVFSVEGAADIADDTIGVERLAAQLGLDHIGRAVQPLRRPKDVATGCARP